MTDIFSFLTEHGIPFEQFDHPAVFTCEEAERLCPPMPGTATKNLLLRDRKGTHNFLVTVGYDTAVDLKGLKDLLQIDKLSFASPERLKSLLGVEPGAVTLLGIVNDTEGSVEVILDEAIWNAEALQCHPLVNTATLVIPHEGIVRFLEATRHPPRILRIPSRKDPNPNPIP
ncbi:MAG: prolyl-tRNA synthetase associated domain-containing protein [Candidatus Peribacteraceae bacterium]|nr:prolyl-tRNA synthetase associated domain-containing protein [Candidatus Peribacteraceae bacterium]MDD5739730.1 prolyl-tRNA synthetase associated domain-containing protein [Candidatus Peribacteraceae bacterium]